jgi:hypothetical protein
VRTAAGKGGIYITDVEKWSEEKRNDPTFGREALALYTSPGRTLSKGTDPALAEAVESKRPAENARSG